MTSSVSNIFALIISLITLALFVAVAVYYNMWDTEEARSRFDVSAVLRCLDETVSKAGMCTGDGHALTKNTTIRKSTSVRSVPEW